MTTEIGQPGKIFNLSEARELLPLIRSVTKSYRGELEPVQDRLNKMLSNDPRRALVEQEFEHLVSRWKDKVEQLGASVYGLWVVEFDVGEGHLIWRYPEHGINFFRESNTNYTEKIRLSRYIDEFRPSWA